MSRSYKKTPIVKDGKSGKVGKKFANKSVRRYKGEIPNGKQYTKLYSSYDIHDYAFRCTFQEHKDKYEEDLKAFLNGGSLFDPRDTSKSFNHWYDDNYWAKCYKRK